jgi:hypothetical protein
MPAPSKRPFSLVAIAALLASCRPISPVDTATPGAPAQPIAEGSSKLPDTWRLDEISDGTPAPDGNDGRFHAGAIHILACKAIANELAFTREQCLARFFSARNAGG